MENGASSSTEGKDPSGFLSEIIGAAVTVKLNSGVIYKGMTTIPLSHYSRVTSQNGQGNYNLWTGT